MIEEKTHIQEIIIEDKIHVRDQDHIQEKEIHQNIDIQIVEKIKRILAEKSFIIALIGIIFLAFSVNLIELACSAGLPVMFTNIIAMNNVSAPLTALYFFLYLLFFMIDDIIVFSIAMITFKVTGISNKYSKYSHLIGGIIMIIIGILMAFKTEWLMFNF